MSTGRPVRQLLAGLAVTVLILAASAATASAHAVLEATTPKNGAKLGALPAEVTLRFDEPPIGVGAVVQVSDPTGRVVSAGSPRIVDDIVHEALAPASPVPTGTYRVAWRVTSDDGHPVSGKFAFTLTSASTSASGTASSPTTSAAAPSPSSTGAGSGGTQPGTAASPHTKDTSGGWLPWAAVVVVILALLGLASASPAVRARLSRRPNA